MPPKKKATSEEEVEPTKEDLDAVEEETVEEVVEEAPVEEVPPAPAADEPAPAAVDEAPKKSWVGGHSMNHGG